MITVSICLHKVISSSQASGRRRSGPTKSVVADKYNPSVLKLYLTYIEYNISSKMTKFHDDIRWFERQFVKLIWAVNS